MIIDRNICFIVSETNKALEDYFSEKKINLIRTDVGDRNIIQSMKKQKFVLTQDKF